MDYHEFVRRVEEKMNMQLQGGVKASVYVGVKNNGKEKRGILIADPKVNVSPVIYLEDFFEHYKNGKTIEEIIREVTEFYNSARLKDSWDCSELADYEKVKYKIAMKLVNTEKNRKLLETAPHLEILDLSIVFYVILNIRKEGMATLLITENQRSAWKVEKEALYRRACANISTLLPAQMVTMEQMLGELLRVEKKEKSNLLEDPKTREEDCLYILTNSEKHLGAACMVYPHVLEMVGKVLEEDFYIIPSSIHEVLVVGKSLGFKAEELDQMVVDVNTTQVAEEEVLSDHVYCYEREGKRLVSLKAPLGQTFQTDYFGRNF